MKEENIILLEKEAKSVPKETNKEPLEKREEISLKKLFEKKDETLEKNVIETPNYDTIQELSPEKRKRIFKLKKENEKQKYKVNSKLKKAIIALSFCVLAIFCITTSVEISKASQNLQQIENEYNASLTSLIQKIYSTETGNRSLDLFETFPEEDLAASSHYETSNWFDRFCNFLTGMFGG